MNSSDKKFFKIFLGSLGWISIMTFGQIIGLMVPLVNDLLHQPDLKTYIQTIDPVTLVFSYSNDMILGGVIAVFLLVAIKILFSKSQDSPLEEFSLAERAKNYLKLNPISPKEAVQYFSLGITLNIVLSFILGLITLILPFEDNTASQYETNVAMIIIIAFLVPIMEEILFRNRIMALCDDDNKLALIAQAAAFSMVHGTLIQKIYTFFFALMLGKVYQNKNSLIPCILIHMGLNFYAGIASVFPETIILLYPFAIFGIPLLVKWIKTKTIA